MFRKREGSFSKVLCKIIRMASSGNIFEICVTYHDGTLQIFELSLEISDKNDMIIKTRL